MEGLTKSVLLWNASSADVKNGIPPASCTNFVAKTGNTIVKLSWTDPEDEIVLEGLVEVKWKSTVIVRKTGSSPTSPTDGTVVLTSRVRNQYTTSSPFLDTGLENETTYYYAAFSCSELGIYSTEPCVISATPRSFRTMTVKIDLNNSNPATCGSYADDAVTMTEGKTSQDWADFFDYKPCLFKDGQVVGYLNPNDYTKFEDGTDADITSGDAGDVMVEFPRRGFRISKSDKVITVSMTDDPDNPEFKYYAHQRGDVEKDYFYLGAYPGYCMDDKMRSISSVEPTTLLMASACFILCSSNGDGYMIIGFYQFVFLQCMYLLQYKGNLDSQTVHGIGSYDNIANHTTGQLNTSGMMYGTSDSTKPIKIFGLEELWGGISSFVGGMIMGPSNSNTIYTATTNFNMDATGYTKHSDAIVKSILGTTGYMSDITGVTEFGFLPTEASGSSTTYFCDYTIAHSTGSSENAALEVGFLYSTEASGGLFYCYFMDYAHSSCGCRLAYL